MARTKLIAGNWKMFTDRQSGRALAARVAEGCRGVTGIQVAIFPPYPYLALIADVLHETTVALGAQNLYPAKEGAFTGEVSPQMLKDVGCEYVIIGHSERRHGLFEEDAFVNEKVRAALAADLRVILCVGETLEQRQSGTTEEVVRRQLVTALGGTPHQHMPQLIVAYEPVWAIGTGQNATPDQAEAVHSFIRGQFATAVNANAADRLQILYGGSVKPENAAALLTQPDVDGALVGGASLNADSFLAIVRAAVA